MVGRGPSSWENSARERTLWCLSQKDALSFGGPKIRAQQWDGTIGDLTFASVLAKHPEIVLRYNKESLSFGSPQDMVDGGWATTGPIIEPWKGGLYGETGSIFGGLKLLVLGESSHDHATPIGEVSPQLTVSTVNDFTSAVCTPSFHSYVTSILASIAGVDPLERKQIWDSIAFSNIIPVVATDYPGGAIPKRLFHLCSPYLDELCEKVGPQAIMIFSKNAWLWFNWAQETPKGMWIPESEAPRKIKGIPTGWTNHSRNPSPQHAKDMLARLCELARAEHI